MYNEDVMNVIYEGIGISKKNDTVLDENLIVSMMDSCILEDYLLEKKGVFDGLKQFIGLKPSVNDSAIYQRLIAQKKYGELLASIMQDSTNGRQKFVNIRYVLMLMKKEDKKFIFDFESDDEKEIREETLRLKSIMEQGDRVDRTDFNNLRNLFIKFFRTHPGFSNKFINTLITFLKIGITFKYIS